MNETTATQDWMPILRRHVATWILETFGEYQIADPWYICQQFSELMSFIAAQPDVAGMPLPVLSLATALLVLGPERSIPPEELWARLCQQAAHLMAHPGPLRLYSEEAGPERWRDLVIAWGCGWQRATQANDTLWDREWERAVLAMRGMVAEAILRTIGELADHLSNQETEDARLLVQSKRDRGLIHSYAISIAVDLIHKCCMCNRKQRRAIGTLTSDGWYSCNQRAHQLANWNPKVCILYHFVLQAVRGSANKTLQGSAFASSMLYPELKHEHNIEIGYVEFKVCHRCHATLIDQARARTCLTIKGIQHGLYEGARCPHCRTPDDPLRQLNYYVARKNWLFFSSIYDQGSRYRCTACGNLYLYNEKLLPLWKIRKLLRKAKLPKDGTSHQQILARIQELQRESESIVCPLCAQHHPQRAFKVWARSTSLIQRIGAWQEQQAGLGEDKSDEEGA